MATVWQDLDTSVIQERVLMAKVSKSNLIAFARFTSPMPSAPLDVRQSLYKPALHHHYMAKQLMRWVYRQGKQHYQLAVPYRHGKTELGVRKLVPWIAGQFPEKSGIVITHTDTLAQEHGRDCREVFRSLPYHLVFPLKNQQLREDSQAMDRLQLNGGGKWLFTGRKGIGGGYGADFIIIDDFFKNEIEAMSHASREEAWKCLNGDCKTRLNEQSGGIIIIGTRRSADDPQGRITDPENIHYDPKEAEKWEVVRLPALAEQDDPMGRKFDEPLWPERFNFNYWNSLRTHRSEIVREDFQVQGQQNPTPSEGKYFKADWLVEYEPYEIPVDNQGDYALRFYLYSDHAYRTGQENDRNCLLLLGIDPSETLWVMPATWWDRGKTDYMVERALDLCVSYDVMTWFAARDAISGSLRPFIEKRMQERKIHVDLDDTLREDKDLSRRGQTIRNRMAMGMVKFPRFWPHWQGARKELLEFPQGAHDDFIAALALAGMKLNAMISANFGKASGVPKKNTFAWHSWGQDKEHVKGWS